MDGSRFWCQKIPMNRFDFGLGVLRDFPFRFTFETFLFLRVVTATTAVTNPIPFAVPDEVRRGLSFNRHPFFLLLLRATYSFFGR
jgi:hypothetical protein